MALHHDVVLARVAVLHPARRMSMMMHVMPGWCWPVMVAYRMVPVPIIRRIRQHRDQHRTDRRAGQHRNHDVAVGGRGGSGSDQTTGQQADLEYATEHGTLLSRQGTFPDSMKRRRCVSCRQPGVNGG